METALKFKSRVSQKRRKLVAEHLRKSYKRVRIVGDSVLLLHRKDNLRVIWTFMLSDCFSEIS